MKKFMLCILILVLAIPAATALAAPKYAGTQPSCDASGNVTIPALPEGRLHNVQLYDDVRGIPPRDLGSVSSFKLEDGAGFNFQWVDRAGTVWFHMITPQTRANGLITDCSHSGGCKFVYRKK
jgi:hypothetical protein